MEFTLGSLFDGSGGFPLAASLVGIKPIWAAEVKPYPIAVTMERFPNIQHLGNVAEIRGDQIPPVDIITFGSPCQDLSIAGKRLGLQNGKRSNLFFEAIRIIHEMREYTHGKYPRFVVWENVYGAFNSNKGKDFYAVIEALCSEAGYPGAIPKPKRNGNGFAWGNAGSIVGDGFTAAWRVMDAQYWGVPQRRRRVFFVADFTGDSAGKVLFERKGLRGYFTPGDGARKDTAENAMGSVDGSDRVSCLTFKERAGCAGGGKGILMQENMSATLGTKNDQGVAYIAKKFGGGEENGLF